MPSKKDSKLKKAGLYIRVSTENQIDRDSLTTQEERLLAYCKMEGITDCEVYRDAGFSAKNTKRPALEKLFRDIKVGGVLLLTGIM